ncbi:acyl-CoA desaturase [Erwinia sorbitola]|uniref:Acyl-CoA desaturase n=1 Tax=Erwinia sorbitola TaxID=2681984 RepID=A0ABW9RE54_9GAMM|nr:acyl-CoA desaturase [Erwinia sorbitola]MTD28382.1 acyl-CoA desaturase [Erwinia sorbitola]
MSETLPPLRYPADGEQAFHQALQRAAHHYLSGSREHRFAGGREWLKAGLLLVLCVTCYLLSLLQVSSGGFVICYLLFMLMAMLLNINVNHDASHGVFSRSPRINRIISRVVTLPLGLDPDYWRVRHVHFHHVYANIEHYDLDTEENGFFRQTPFQRWRPWMRWQHLYWPLIAALSLPYLAWVFDWADRCGKTPLAQRQVMPGVRGWLLFCLSKILHLLLVLAIPLWAAEQHGIAISVVLATWLGSQMAASLLVVFLLLGTHWAEAEFYQPGAEGELPHGWYRHNFATACDWQPSPAWLGYFTGGLNLHLTHHLFPGWHHRHYPALAVILARLASEHGMNYRCISYRELLRRQQAFLRRMGQPQEAL